MGKANVLLHFGIISLLFGGISSAQMSSGIKNLTLIYGECTIFIANKAGDCENEVAWLVSNTGIATFSFSEKDRVINLHGRGDQQPDPSNYFQNIQKLEFFQQEFETFEADGRCHLKLSADASEFYSLSCFVLNKNDGNTYVFNLDNISGYDRQK